MSQQFYDPSSKWMMEEHGASILWLAGQRSVVSCKARKAEVVQPRKLPDGLLEARLVGSKDAQLILVEVATYPEPRVVEQMSDGLRLVLQARGVLADGLVLCLCPRGQYRVPESVEQASALGWSAETIRWKVVELWTLSAEELLAAPNVAVSLWATLAKFEGPPEVLLRRCRDRIDRDGGQQRANLLAVAQVFARLHFNRPEWLDILGGRTVMIESPLIQELVQESGRDAVAKATLNLLQERFGSTGTSAEAGLALVKEVQAQIRLNLRAATCASLEAFEKAMREELPKQPPASTRGRRKTHKEKE